SLPSRNLLSAEWRDPEDVSFAMRLQGVLPRSPVATTQSRRKNSSKWIAFHLASNLAPNCCSGEDDRDKGREGLPETACSRALRLDLSTPRQRFLWYTSASRRSGRDDRMRGSLSQGGNSKCNPRPFSHVLMPRRSFVRFLGWDHSIRQSPVP